MAAKRPPKKPTRTPRLRRVVDPRRAITAPSHTGHHHDSHAGHHHDSHAGHHHDEAPSFAPSGQPLAPAAGRGQVLFLDTFSGIAGDMTIAALVDLGVPFEVVEAAVATLGIGGYELALSRVYRASIASTRFEVKLGASGGERSHAEIDALIAKAPLQAEVSRLARAIFLRLAEAEAKVHGIAVSQVHFHEVGAVDAIVDIVGAAACFGYLQAVVVSAPLPMGRGFVDCRHGRLPLPPPATVGCLLGVPTYAVDVDAELVTPTGAAIVSTVAARFESWPGIAPTRVGYGAGERVLPDRPNLLRVVLGKPVPVAEGVASSFELLEANLDDVTGEVAAHALQALLAAGARDAWASPITMKKGRPGLVLSALVERKLASHVATVLLTETPSLGVRRLQVERLERPRREMLVETPWGSVRVKVSDGPYGPPQVKPEFEDCARVAREASVPLREVSARALALALTKLG